MHLAVKACRVLCPHLTFTGKGWPRDFTTDCSWARAGKTPCSYPPRPLTHSWDSGPQTCTPCEPGSQPQGLGQVLSSPAPITSPPPARATGSDATWWGAGAAWTQASWTVSVCFLARWPRPRLWNASSRPRAVLLPRRLRFCHRVLGVVPGS